MEESLGAHEHIEDDKAALHSENQESEQTLNPDQLDQAGANFTKAAFPQSRVKYIMKLDDVPNIAKDALYAVSLAAELFLEVLSKEAAQYTLKENRKIVLLKDVASAINDVYEFEFLDDIVAFTMKHKESQPSAPKAESGDKKIKGVDLEKSEVDILASEIEVEA